MFVNPPKNSWVRKINLDLPSRKLTHPTNGSSENHRLTSAQLDGVCDRSQKGSSRSRNFGNSPNLCFLVDGGNIPQGLILKVRESRFISLF